MWSWFTRYPFAPIEDIGTSYVKDLTNESGEDVAEYDYIIVGGLSRDFVGILIGQEGQQDVCWRTD